MHLLEAVAEREGVHAQVAAEHRAAPREPEEVAELTGAAAALEHAGAVRNLLVEEPGELPLGGLAPELLRRIEVVVTLRPMVSPPCP